MSGVSQAAISCPSCAGCVPAPRCSRDVICHYCGERWLWTDPSWLPAKWARAAPMDPRNVVRAFMATADVDPRLHQLAYFERPAFFRVPLLHRHLRVATRTAAPAMRSLRVELEDDQRGRPPAMDTHIQFSSLERATPLVRLPGWGVGALAADWTRRTDLVLDAERPKDPAGAVCLDPVKDLLDTALHATGSTPSALVQQEILDAQDSVVFYPVWVVRYLFHGAVYRITVDAVTGTVLAGHFPCGIRTRVAVAAVSLWPVAAVLGWIAAVVGGSLRDPDGYPVPPAVVAPLLAGVGSIAIWCLPLGIVWLIVMGAVWQEYRFGNELVVDGAHRSIQQSGRAEEERLAELRSVFENEGIATFLGSGRMPARRARWW